MRILLVEDNVHLARGLQVSLLANKTVLFEIETADTLESALKILQEQPCEMILLDLGLPDSSGLETFEKITLAHPEIACVILSGMDDEALALEAVKRGAQDYVVKGDVHEEMLPRILSYAFERQQKKKRWKNSMSVLKSFHFSILSLSCSIAAVFNVLFPGNLKSQAVRDQVFP